jgi:hypothetical protein
MVLLNVVIAARKDGSEDGSRKDVFSGWKVSH